MRALIEAAVVRCHPARPLSRGRADRVLPDAGAALEAAAWDLALDHERRAMRVATLESGALEALTGARRVGFATAIWTNNARGPHPARALAPRPHRRGRSGGHARRHAGAQAGSRRMARDRGTFPRSARRDARRSSSAIPGSTGGRRQGRRAVRRLPRQQADLDRWRVRPVAHFTDLALIPDWLRPDATGGASVDLFGEPERSRRPPRGHRRRWPTACVRARSTRSWGRSICWGPAGCCEPRSRRASCTR